MAQRLENSAALNGFWDHLLSWWFQDFSSHRIIGIQGSWPPSKQQRLQGLVDGLSMWACHAIGMGPKSVLAMLGVRQSKPKVWTLSTGYDPTKTF
jgi:hypothetical protein